MMIESNQRHSYVQLRAHNRWFDSIAAHFCAQHLSLANRLGGMFRHAFQAVHGFTSLKKLSKGHKNCQTPNQPALTRKRNGAKLVKKRCNFGAIPVQKQGTFGAAGTVPHR